VIIVGQAVACSDIMRSSARMVKVCVCEVLVASMYRQKLCFMQRCSCLTNVGVACNSTSTIGHFCVHLNSHCLPALLQLPMPSTTATLYTEPQQAWLISTSYCAALLVPALAFQPWGELSPAALATSWLTLAGSVTLLHLFWRQKHSSNNDSSSNPYAFIP
jgi:hypothetical protein